MYAATTKSSLLKNEWLTYVTIININKCLLHKCKKIHYRRILGNEKHQQVNLKFLHFLVYIQSELSIRITIKSDQKRQSSSA